jgi:hypothetical protein
MITKAGPIDGLEHTFIQPIVKQIVNDLNTKIIKDPNASFYNLGNYQHENVNVGDNIDDNTIQGPMLYVEYEIEDDEDMMPGTSSYNPMNKIFLLDKENGFNVRPSYRPIKLTITLTYKSRSKTNFNRIIQRLRTHYDNSGYSIAHNLEYSYLIPNNVLLLINDIKDLKDSSMNLHDYINSISLYKLDYTVKRGSDRTTPVFRGRFNNIFGYIETNPSDLEIEKQDDPYYSMGFKYVVNIKQPDMLFIQYPIIVNNKKLPSKWLPEYSIGKSIEHAEGKINISDIIGNYNRLRDNNVTMHRIPTYDNFYPLPYDDNAFIRIVSILLEIDPNKPNYLFNIDDLKYIGFPLVFIEYLKLCGDTDLFNFYMSLVYIELYNHNDKKDHGLYKDENNNIFATKPLDIKGSYHLVINILNDKAFISYYGKSKLDQNKIDRDNIIIDEYKLPIKGIGKNILPTKIQ